MGKGSKPRPVDPRRYAANYAAIRWSDPPTVAPAVSTPVGSAGPADRPPYPDWICHECGFSYGRLPDGRLIATYHQDTCGICGKTTSVTEPRDYGHLREWPLVTRHSSPVTSS
jgi:hypothetical protein